MYLSFNQVGSYMFYIDCVTKINTCTIFKRCSLPLPFNTQGIIVLKAM